MYYVILEAHPYGPYNSFSEARKSLNKMAHGSGGAFHSDSFIVKDVSLHEYRCVPVEGGTPEEAQNGMYILAHSQKDAVAIAEERTGKQCVGRLWKRNVQEDEK